MKHVYRWVEAKLLILLSLMLTSVETKAQGNDPGLAALLEIYKGKAERMYKAQEDVMALETTNHIWLNSETKAIYDLQKEFNEYISAFRGVIVYAAQVYGFYYEIENLIGNMNIMSHEIGDNPSNPFAVALSARRNDIFIQIINTTSGIINNVRVACIGPKMTEKERIELIFDIRPRLQKLNVQLRKLNKMLRYTDMADVWREIRGRTYDRDNKSAIIRQAMRDWKYNGRKIKPN